MDTKKRRLTEDHVKLLRRACVEWDDGAYDGAPAFNIKRPYGNSYVAGDVCEILGWTPAHKCDHCGNEWSEAQEAKALEIHRETETALQIVLASGSFEPGIYEADVYRRNWRRVDE